MPSSDVFSIILLTYNEEKNIEACLDSIAGLTEQVFVVDSYSTDRTLAILQQRCILYQQHPFTNYSHQRNWAQQNNPFKTEWVFHVDAGERVTPELSAWLRTGFDPLSTLNGFMFSRRTLFFDKWIRYGGHYPNFHLRLFRTAFGQCEDKVYDQHFICSGTLQSVKPGIDIVDTVADNLRDFSVRHAKWAMYEAVEIVAASTRNASTIRPNLFGSPIERKRFLKNHVFQKTPLFVRSIGYFMYRYFIRLGFLDGSKGLVFHFLQGFWFRFLVDAMVLELRYKMKKSQRTLAQLIEQEYPPELLVLLTRKAAGRDSIT